MIRPPPTPTRFPYTTLFRSHPAPVGVRLGEDQPQPEPGLGEVHWFVAVGDLADQLVHALDAGVVGGDRKSTRLNSSHVAISYAVFCLKKKKHRQTQCEASRT